MYIARSHIGKEMVNRSVEAIGAVTPLKPSSHCSARRCVALRLLLVALRCVADARSQCLRLDARNASGHIIIAVS